MVIQGPVSEASGDTGISMKSEGGVRMTHKQMVMKKLLSTSNNKLASKSSNSLGTATNSSSHFPRFITEAVRLNVM